MYEAGELPLITNIQSLALVMAVKDRRNVVVDVLLGCLAKLVLNCTAISEH